MSKKGYSATSTKSVQDAKKRLTAYLKRLDTVPLEIVEDEAEHLYQEILNEVPYDTGKLERSVRVKVAKDKRRPGINASASAKSKTGYDYAGIQHETELFKHPTLGTKDHYISDPFHRCTNRIKKAMSRELKIVK